MSPPSASRLAYGVLTVPNWEPREDQIVCVAPPYADVEPYRNLPENDSLASALSGVLGGTGTFRGGPAFPMMPTLSYAVGVLIAVGAAFDFHAGVLKQAPGWMQDRGLEWLFRFAHEPRRLWRRYAILNPLFCWKVTTQWLFPRSFRAEDDIEPAGRQNFV